MDISESSITPRSRTTPVDWMVVEQMDSERCWTGILTKLVREPNQINSVLYGFNCRCNDKNAWPRSLTHEESLLRSWWKKGNLRELLLYYFNRQAALPATRLIASTHSRTIVQIYCISKKWCTVIFQTYNNNQTVEMEDLCQSLLKFLVLLFQSCQLLTAIHNAILRRR